MAWAVWGEAARAADSASAARRMRLREEVVMEGGGEEFGEVEDFGFAARVAEDDFEFAAVVAEDLAAGSAGGCELS